ncbi:MAG: anti-sigma factor [Panacagrimonas sp.]
MNLHDPELRGLLAAEYVLGTLRGSARDRFERVMEGNALVRADVYFWEMRLVQMTESISPIAPPEHDWEAVKARMFPLPAASPKVVPIRKVAEPDVAAPRRRVSRRSFVAGLATAAGLMLAVMLGQQHFAPTRSVPMLAGLSSNADDAPMYVTLLRAPASQVQWLVSLSTDQRQVNVVAAGDYPQLAGRKVQLWWISPRLGPVALGLLPSRNGASADIRLPDQLSSDTASGFDLAVSLEPENSSPQDMPDGPIVTSARNLTAQRVADRGI